MCGGGVMHVKWRGTGLQEEKRPEKCGRGVITTTLNYHHHHHFLHLSVAEGEGSAILQQVGRLRLQRLQHHLSGVRLKGGVQVGWWVGAC